LGTSNTADGSGPEIKPASLAYRMREGIEAKESISEEIMKIAIALFLLWGLPLIAQDMQSCPMHKQHQASVEKHGDEAMGFPHDSTTHHFRLSADGGAIEVTVNDSKDVQNIQAIRAHLIHIVTMFSNGDFSMPMFVHSKIPPGTTEMKERQADISYTFEELATGGRVRISTKNHDALNAIQDFLRFQIEDHDTGDKMD
jgi:hypothetical protein